MDGAAIAKGAEGSVYLSTYLGRDAVTKVRTPKGYRVPELDRRIRTQRIRSEARLIREARAAGIRTPIIYDIDTVECSITMERVKGVTVKRYLDEHPEDAERICRLIGTNIARLHNSKICHGDLTTSNMILTPAGELCIIDFSMGASLIGVEDMGVDLRLLERGFTSAHPDIKDAYEYITEAYCQEKTGAQEVLDKVQEIKDRGRYT
jgi:TP53 regulating kinase-like protein/N6-L-threonylcarbamoyladenine synthase/protein kinase Bud32